MYFNSTKKDVRIVNKNIYKIVNNIFILTNTNNLFVCSNILKFKDLITYKNMLFMHNVHLKKCPSRISLLFPRYNNLYKNTFHNFKLPHQSFIINHYHLNALYDGIYKNVYKKLQTNIKRTSFIKI